MTFQQVQAVNETAVRQEPKDNSDQGELQEWIDNNNALTDAEKELYREIPQY